MNLSPRLLKVADLVRNGVKIVDVGTDHAYLPAYLVMSGRVVSAIACDVADGPLANARDTVNKYRLQDRIELRLSDGLEEISPSEADDICICGMGGELIADIIDGAEWLKSSDKRLILQPMSAVDDLRIYLAQNGFELENEILVNDSGRIYCVMLAAYSGKSITYSPEYPYIGNINCDTQIEIEYVSKQLKRISKHIEMLKNASDKTGLPRLMEIRDLIRNRLGDNND